MRIIVLSGIRLASLITLATLISGLPASALDFTSLITSYSGSNQRKPEITGTTQLFGFYDKVISPIDGDRCRMSPSCSRYSREAIAKHGFIKGIIQTLDRLQRCGFDLDSYPRNYDGYMELFVDPIIAHRHWKTEKQ